MIEIGDSIVPREASDTERRREVILRFVLLIFHAPSLGTLAASACATKMQFCGNGAGRSRSHTMQFFRLDLRQSKDARSRNPAALASTRSRSGLAIQASKPQAVKLASVLQTSVGDRKQLT